MPCFFGTGPFVGYNTTDITGHLGIDMARIVLLSILAFVSLAGCGPSGPARYPISGEVTLDGQPLSEGLILFYPADNKLDADTAPIANGKFSLTATSGAKRVEIEATKPSDKEEPSAIDGKPVRQRISLIPSRYKRNQLLKAEVIAGSNPPLRFDLTTKEN